MLHFGFESAQHPGLRGHQPIADRAETSADRDSPDLSSCGPAGDVREEMPQEIANPGPSCGLHEESAMSNPWLKKNPFLSLWLSGANSVANTVRGKAASQAQRHAKATAAQATQNVVSFWTKAMGLPTKPARRKKR